MRSISRLIPLVALVCAAPALAQELIPGGPAVGIDDRFVVARGLDSPPSFLEVLDDGTGEYLYAAGGFVTADGEEVNGLARWDGERWEGVGDGSVFRRIGKRAVSIEAMAFFDDGSGQKLYVGGWFDHVGDVEAKGVACWDGQRWSQAGEGFSLGESTGFVSSLVVFDDGAHGPRLFAGGWFGRSGDSAIAHLAILDEGQWRPVPATNELRLAPAPQFPGADHPIRDMTTIATETGPALIVGLHDDGEIVGEERFDRIRIAAFDGSAWRPMQSMVEHSVLGSVPDVIEINSFAVGTDGVLYGAGSFYTVEPRSPTTESARHSPIGRWDGDRWRAFVQLASTAGARVAVISDGGKPSAFFLTQNGTVTLLRSKEADLDWSPPWKVAESTLLLREETLGQRQHSFTYGRLARHEVTVFDGQVYAALGKHPLSPNGPATSVVRLTPDGWRSASGAGQRGALGALGANQIVSALAVTGNDHERRLLCTGGFSEIGDAAGTFVAEFGQHGWAPIGSRHFVQFKFEPLPDLVALHRAGGDEVFVVGRSTPPDDIFDGNLIARVTGDDLTLTPVGDDRFGETFGRVGDFGAGERMFLSRTTDFGGSWSLLERDAGAWRDLELEDFLGRRGRGQFGILGNGESAQIIVPARYYLPFGRVSSGVAWNGSSWSYLPDFGMLWMAGEPDVVTNARLGGRDLIVALGGGRLYGESVFITTFDGDAWEPLPGAESLRGARIESVRPIRLAGRSWVMINADRTISGEPLSAVGLPALNDGERLVPLSDVLGETVDGRVYDILSNPLPDGREEVILAGDFLTIGGVPSARIGRVILPALEDVNGDGIVDGRDVAAVARAMRTDDPDFDLDFDGDVDRDDMAIVLERVRGSGRR